MYEITGDVSFQCNVVPIPVSEKFCSIPPCKPPVMCRVKASKGDVVGEREGGNEIKYM